jgi:hypothetical protein
MSFLRGLFSRGEGKSKHKEPSDPDGIRFYVQCDKCGEKIAIRIDKRYDLTRDPSSRTKVFSVRKEILGSKCRNLMHADIQISTGGKLLAAAVEGGQQITWDEHIGEDEDNENS